MKPRVLAVIPARYQSRRFPGKALAVIAGKPLIEHIYQEAVKARLIDRVVVATDSPEIARGVAAFDGELVITSKRHRTGSDRVAEAMEKLGGMIVLNIQADHIGLKRGEYDRVLQAMLADRKIRFASLIASISRESDLYDPNRIKVIANATGHAIWFSR
ncbi:MAG: NTP transferase domain-containing protein, partial [Candidatus Zixiibacteriota bacterium]